MKKDTRDRDELFNNIKHGMKFLKQVNNKEDIFYPFSKKVKFLVHIPLINTKSYVKKVRLLFRGAWKAYSKKNEHNITAQLDVLESVSKGVEKACKTPAYFSTIKQAGELTSEFNELKKERLAGNIKKGVYFQGIKDLKNECSHIKELVEKQKATIFNIVDFKDIPDSSENKTSFLQNINGLNEFLPMVDKDLKLHHKLMNNFLRTYRVDAFAKKVYDLQVVYLKNNILYQRKLDGDFSTNSEDRKTITDFNATSRTIDKEFELKNAKPVKIVEAKNTNTINA
jgi:hypothetical protein